MKSWKVAGIQDCAATNPVEIGDLDGRLIFIDRIVSGSSSMVRTVTEGTCGACFLVHKVGRVFRLFHPVALLDAHNVHTRFRETISYGRAGCASTDDQNVDRLFCHGESLQHLDWSIPREVFGMEPVN